MLIYIEKKQAHGAFHRYSSLKVELLEEAGKFWGNKYTTRPGFLKQKQKTTCIQTWTYVLNFNQILTTQIKIEK